MKPKPDAWMRYRNCFEALQRWTKARRKAPAGRNASSRPGGLSSMHKVIGANTVAHVSSMFNGIRLFVSQIR
jgi:hypothetical protein